MLKVSDKSTVRNELWQAFCWLQQRASFYEHPSRDHMTWQGGYKMVKTADFF
jgi:hypothetical protein